MTMPKRLTIHPAHVRPEPNTIGPIDFRLIGMHEAMHRFNSGVFADCESCSYFHEDSSKNDGSGECHAAPPTHFGWPKVHGDSWCGFFTAVVRVPQHGPTPNLKGGME